MTKKASRPNTTGRPDEYFARGFEFYIDGRHGTFCGQVQASAYLFHLAVELMFKAVLLSPAYEEAMKCIDAERDALVAKLGLAVVNADPDKVRIDAAVGDACLDPYRKKELELKDVFVHRLVPLWRAAKTQLGKPELDKFDSVVNKVSEWEGFRYPGFVHSRGNVITFSPFKVQRAKGRSRDLVNRYDVNREEIDELVAGLLTTGGYSPAWIQMRVARGLGAGLDTYRRDNRHVMPGI